MKMQESGQDYLEAILILSNEGKNVRAVDICEYFGYARATVSIFLKQLRENGYVKIAEHNEILLTDKGKEIANEVYEKHSILSQIFKSIDVSGLPANAILICDISYTYAFSTSRILASFFLTESS